MTKRGKKVTKDTWKKIGLALAGKQRISKAYAWDHYEAHTYDVAGLIRRAKRLKASKGKKS